MLALRLLMGVIGMILSLMVLSFRGQKIVFDFNGHALRQPVLCVT